VIVNYSNNVNKSKNYVSPQIIEYKKVDDVWRWESRFPGLGSTKYESGIGRLIVSLLFHLDN
jgi:hypothetical protein